MYLIFSSKIFFSNKLILPITIFFLFSIFSFILSYTSSDLNTTIILVTLSSVICLISYFKVTDNLLLKPSILYALSVLLFILARPIINLIGDIEIVSVGNGINDKNILRTLSVILLSLSITSISYSAGCLKESFFYDRKYLYVRQPILNNFLYYSFLILGCIFLYNSYLGSQLIGKSSYFDLINDENHFSHLKYFFLAKIICLLWLLNADIKYNNFLRASFLLFFFSIGFLIIGLRGYFISYLFLYLFFLNIKYKFNIIYLLVGALVLLLGSSYILEYRLGFSVYHDWIDMVIQPFYDQGATFEVVFGSVIFSNEISRCMPLFDYLLKTIPFGGCVDSSRGVPFVDGGFASSFFAEAYYLSIFIYVILSVLIGYFLKFLDQASCYIKKDLMNELTFALSFILFIIIPNLIYFGRASAFDFILKFTEGIIFLILFFKNNKKYTYL